MATITSGAERFLRAAKNVPLDYEPFPKQQQFHASPAKYRLFGGAAGPGKTKALLMEAILQADEHPGANTLLLRRTFPELEQSLLLYFRRDVPRELYKSFNESKHVVTWQNGSTTRFGYCQSESDVYQYQGAEFLFIGIDELTLFTLRQWQFLTSRNRCPIPGAFPCMAGATNPGNIGHAWVKSLWIDKQPAPGMENASEYDPADYDFIPARVSDNPVYAGDENYLKTLRALPSHLRRAFFDGNWDVFAGQYFDNFDCSRHVLRAELPDWQRWWPRWISIDWGFEHPAAVYWHCVVPGGAGTPACAPTTDSCLDAAHSSRVGASTSAVGAQHTVPGAALATGSDVQSVGDGPLLADGATAPSTFSGRSSAVPLQKQNHSQCIVTYREYVTRRTTPRDLAHEIVRRSVRNDCHSETGRLVDGAEESAFRSHAGRDSRSLTPIREDLGRVRDDSSHVGGRVEGQGFSPAKNDEREARSTLPQAVAEAQVGPPGRRLVEPGGSVPERHDDPSSGAPEKIDAIYLSPDAFAHRTGEASIAEQMGDVFAAAGLPRPVPADDDRVGGWMLMYQMLEAAKRGPQVDGESSLGDQAWLLTDNCFELIRTLPSLVRDPVRVEDIEKCDGDDPADAARYGLKSRYAAHRGDPGGWRSRMPLADRIASHAYSADPTIRAMQSRKFALEESGRIKPPQFERSRGPQRIPFRHGPRRP